MRAALALAPALLLAACGQQPASEPPAANQSSEINALAADLDALESDVRIRRLEARIEGVEAQLGNVTLRDSEIEALDARVHELEVEKAGKRLAAPGNVTAP